MLQRVLCLNSVLHVVLQQPIQKLDSLWVAQRAVLCVDEGIPRTLLAWANEPVELLCDSDVVLGDVLPEAVRTKHFDDFDELIDVVLAAEEGLFHKDHPSEHAAETPHVEVVVVQAVVHEELGALEVARRDTDVVFRADVVEL